MSKLILITNPGSASRKYALYDGDQLLAQLHFEYEGKKVVCTLKDNEGKKTKIKVDDLKDLAECAARVPKILEDEQYINSKNKLVAIVVRVVAPGDFFVEHRVVDDEYRRPSYLHTRSGAGQEVDRRHIGRTCGKHCLD